MDTGFEGEQRVSAGSVALDDILNGGFDANRLYLVEGKPGTGKTTLALQFLIAGAKRGERTLYVTLSETADELRLVAKRHGWSLENIDIFELTPAEAALNAEMELTVVHPAEVELNETLQSVFDKVDEVSPTRVVFDSLSELRLLAHSPLRYRRQMLAVKHFFQAAIPRSCCSTTFRRRNPMCSFIPLRMASFISNKPPSITAPNGGACVLSKCAA